MKKKPTNNKAKSQKLIGDPHTTNLIARVDEVLKTLQATKTLRCHFLSDIQALERKQHVWKHRAWRVALIGVTSSGKSSLLNAILGADVLPRHVRPTTNGLVVCREGCSEKAIIHYKDKESQHLEGADIVSHLRRLTDEKTNPENREAIKEIELEWPSFSFPKGVELVDTPGLDAYNLEAHERLTMQFLLPIVDAVVFVATVKANSDKSIQSYLDSIGEHRKPVIFVQNMIDSVVPKKGRMGTILRTREQVAQDHADRARDLLQHSAWQVIQSAPVVQVSALWALEKDRRDQSGLSQLIDRVEYYLADVRSILCLGRYDQLLGLLQKLVDRECRSKGDEQLSDEIDHEVKELDEIVNQIEHLQSTLDKNLTQKFVKAKNNMAVFREEAEGLGSKDRKIASALVSRIKSWSARYKNSFSKVLMNAREEYLSLAKRLDISEEDTLAPHLPEKRNKTLKLEEKSTSKECTREKSREGFFGWLCDFFGKEKETYTVIEKTVNIDKLKLDIATCLEDEEAYMHKICRCIPDSLSRYAEALNKEILTRRKALQKKRSARATLEKRMEAVAECKRLRSEIESQKPSDDAFQITSQENPTLPTENDVSVEVPTTVVHLAQLATLITRIGFRAMRDEMLDRADRESARKVQKALICGWDEATLQDFCSLYWGELKTEKLTFGSSVKSFGQSKRLKTIAGIKLEAAGSSGDQQSKLKPFIREGSILFLVIDPEQPGATAKYLRESGLPQLLQNVRGRGPSLVLVAQSLRVLDLSNCLLEGLREFFRLGEMLEEQPAKRLILGILVNDDRAWMTGLADKLFREGDSLLTHADEKDWLAWFTQNDHGLHENPDARQTLSGLLRAWREENEA